VTVIGRIMIALYGTGAAKPPFIERCLQVTINRRGFGFLLKLAPRSRRALVGRREGISLTSTTRSPTGPTTTIHMAFSLRPCRLPYAS